ncbi:MAG: ArnT family glycosyltransferase [Nanobdellota archaeon]
MMPKNTDPVRFLRKNRRLFGFLFILAVFVVVLSLLAQESSFLNWDEPVYLSNARSHIDDSNYTEDFRFPLLEFVIAGIWSLFGESVALAKAVMVLFSSLSVYAMYLVSKELFDDSLPVLLSTFLFSFSSVMFIWGFRIYTDIPALGMMLFSLYFFFRGQRSSGLMPVFFSGGFATLAFLFRFPVALFVLPLIVYYLYKKHFRRLFFFCAGAFSFALPWLVYNLVNYGNPLWDLFAQGSAVAEYTSFQSPYVLLSEVVSQFSFGLLFILAAFFAFRHGCKRKEYFMMLSFLLILEFLLYLFVVKLKLTRYVLVLLPLIVLLEVKGLDYLRFRLRGLSGVLYNSAMVILLLLLLVPLYLSSVSSLAYVQEKIDCENDGAMARSVDYIRRTVPSDKVVLSNFWPWFGYYGNHNVSSFWLSPEVLFTDENLYFEKIDPDKIVICDDYGLEGEYDSLEEYSEFVDPEKVFEDDCGKTVTVYDVSS